MSIEAKQVYEWVKTGHWSLREFKDWLTEAEKTAFAFGWWKAMETKRDVSETHKWVNATTWRGLTDEEIEDCYKQGGIGRAIQMLKEKNSG